MPYWNSGYFGCPVLRDGRGPCTHGCTETWPLCHKFINGTCHEQHLPEYCRKGYHVRQDKRRASDGDDERPRQKRRVDYAAPAKTFRTEQEKTDKQEVRLGRLGFFDAHDPTQEALEWAYNSHKKIVENSEDGPASKRRQLKKLKSAWKNIGKAIHGHDPEPSTDDDDEHGTLENHPA